jgi:hypothetical protein
MEQNEKYAKAWRTAGWIFLAVAIVVVAGPQILDLITGG